ncbi:MAG TPA: GntR family transcriptional regulator [Blastocatellia bacterium]|nr:GntR family transcriptional regulator [Blastocatellia bacterium]HMV85199.1 GntR family transcriptional regulator [Blastocatellia bacterium]HMZ23286.1 GntR family transcriptional regulator [Blastocatellia bacterium]HNG28697.1 GntR family transcriptional regulator [Blastocatellia bacterium]
MSGKALKLIQPVSKRDQVVASFKEAILSGLIQPGESIVESRVAQQLGAGIPLVREALIELEHQGYVQKIPYKGTTVTKLAQRDVEKIFRLRVELESLAIEWARENVTPADIEDLRNITIKMREGAEALNLDQFYQNDLAFHRKLWEMSGNDYLVDCLERIVAPLFAFFLMKDRRERESYLFSAEQHEKIVEALPRLSGAKLRALMRNSISEWKTEVFNAVLPRESE